MKYHIIVYGCQMNISDAERVSAVLEGIKYKKTSTINEADLVVIAMCSVRQSAVDRVQSIADKFKNIKKTNPKFKAVLTGCVLKKDKKRFFEGFDYVIDIKDIKKLSRLLGNRGSSMPIKSASGPEKNQENYLNITPKYSSNFSANVPIMTGCNNFCSYCVVPYVRERETSRPAKEIILEIKNLINPPAGGGYKEIWLLGQNVNSYKDNKTNFPTLLKMANNIPGNFWIRFTSSHPKDFSDEVINAMAECKKVTPYLNLPIQSGDDKVLKLMNRHYTVKDYKNKIKKLREKIPDICLSTDIIVGFPGETKKQFENTTKLFRDIKYDMAYINKYSPRHGTAATKLKDNVPVDEKKSREKVLNEILKQTALEKNKKLIGKEDIVLIDGNKNENWYGKDKHYKTVQIKSLPAQAGSKNLLGKFINVKITEAMAWSLKGEINE